MMAMTNILVCYFLAVTWSFAAIADEIVLQRASLFSLYAPATCRKVEQAIFAMVLHCDLGGKTVRFYLKEFPGQLNPKFDPRENPPSRVHADAYANDAWR